MENNSFNDMPVAPTPPKLPKYFPDLQGENRGRTPHAAHCCRSTNFVQKIADGFQASIWVP